MFILYFITLRFVLGFIINIIICFIIIIYFLGYIHICFLVIICLTHNSRSIPFHSIILDEPIEYGYIVDVTSHVDGRPVPNAECCPVVDNVSMEFIVFGVHQNIGQLRVAPFLFAAYPQRKVVGFRKDVAWRNFCITLNKSVGCCVCVFVCVSVCVCVVLLSN